MQVIDVLAVSIEYGLDELTKVCMCSDVGNTCSPSQSGCLYFALFDSARPVELYL